MLKITQIDHLVLTVADIARTCDFYREVLGMEVVHFGAGRVGGPGGKSIGKVAPDIYENPEGAMNNDGNTVDLEREMSSLAENSIMYKAALQLMNKKMAALRYAAGDGR